MSWLCHFKASDEDYEKRNRAIEKWFYANIEDVAAYVYFHGTTTDALKRQVEMDEFKIASMQQAIEDAAENYKQWCGSYPDFWYNYQYAISRALIGKKRVGIGIAYGYVGEVEK